MSNIKEHKRYQQRHLTYILLLARHCGLMQAGSAAEVDCIVLWTQFMCIIYAILYIINHYNLFVMFAGLVTLKSHGRTWGVYRYQERSWPGIPKLKWNCVTIFVINCFPQLDQHRHALLGLEVHAFSIPTIASTGRGRGLEMSAQPM